jgi:hypothetical protein
LLYRHLYHYDKIVLLEFYLEQQDQQLLKKNILIIFSQEILPSKCEGLATRAYLTIEFDARFKRSIHVPK